MKNKIAIVLIAIIAVSALAFVADASAMPFMSMKSARVNRVSVQQSYVLVDGKINASGTTPVAGTIQVQSRTTVLNSTNVYQGFSATALWTTNTTRPIASVESRQNFTYTFYSARLVNGNFSALDYNGNSFFMNGTWNVWSITETFTINTLSNGTITNVNSNQNAVPLANQAYGTFTVASGWSTFTLAINGVDPLTGTVFAERTTSGMFNPFMINIGGSTTSTTVTSGDINSIVKAYGAMPGFGNYDQRLDYCLHYKIDICDLSTAAANLNSAQ